MVVLIIFVGIIGSIASQQWLPVVGALVIATLVQEAMLYDLHRHVLNLEDNING